jgi:hypothetical protein
MTELEKRFYSIVNDPVHELAPGLVEVSRDALRQAEKLIPPIPSHTRKNLQKIGFDIFIKDNRYNVVLDKDLEIARIFRSIWEVYTWLSGIQDRDNLIRTMDGKFTISDKYRQECMRFINEQEATRVESAPQSGDQSGREGDGAGECGPIQGTPASQDAGEIRKEI